MTKQGDVQLGFTPSTVSGKPCTRIEAGEPLAADEALKVSLEKLSREIEPPTSSQPVQLVGKTETAGS